MEQPIPSGGAVVVTMPSALPKSVAGLDWTSVPIRGESFDHVLRATISQQPAHPYDAQLAIPVAANVAARDVLLAVIRVRGHGQQSPEATTSFRYESTGTGGKSSVSADFTVGDQWTTFYFPFEAATSTAAGQAQVTLRLGFAVQTLDVGDVRLLNFGRTKRIDELPTTRFTYAGREPDAAWRRAADERIDKFRKGDLRVEVVDVDGRPVAGAVVAVEMTRHAFRFGTAVSSKVLLDDASADGDKYRSELLRLFNTATPDNDLKWPAVDASAARAEAVVDWLDAHHLNVRGHNLIWPSWKPYYLPPRVKAEYFRQHDDASTGPARAADYLRGEVAAHITRTATTFAGKVVDWDVVNEPYNEHDVLDILGSSVMADWYKLAHAADPNARLVLNDYGILSGGGVDTKNRTSSTTRPRR